MMVYDADTHFLPIEVFTELDSDLVTKLKAKLDEYDINHRWVEYYDSIKDLSWPNVKSIEDFHNLPRRIKQEIREEHHTPGMYISPDLSEIYYDPMENQWPDLMVTAKSGHRLLRTQRQVLNPHGIPFCYNDDRFGVDFMRTYNRVMLDICDRNPRFDTPMMLSLAHIDAAMQELEIYRDTTFFGVRLIDQHPWGFLHEMEPVYAFCNEHRMPLYLHLTQVREESWDIWSWNQNDPNYVKLRQKFNENYRKEFFAQSTESSNWIIGLLSFITQGVLDRYPELRIVSTENGLAWIPRVREWCLTSRMPDPLPYFQKNFWFTAEVEEPDFLSTAQMVGWDRLLYATDYPHNDPGGNNRFYDLDAITTMRHNGSLSQHQFELFTYRNYQRLLHRL